MARKIVIPVKKNIIPKITGESPVKKNVIPKISAKKTIIPKITAKKSMAISDISKRTDLSAKKVLTKAELEQALLNNFVNLQKVLTNLSVKFEQLSDNISKLLQLFEISAKSFAEKYSGEGEGRAEENKHLANKLDSLIDQNKIIAKGIMLMEERIRGRASPQIKRETEPEFQRMFRSKTSPDY